jgi:hypothetical protein
LAPDDEQDGGFAIDQSIVAQVFDGVRDGGDIGKPYGRALPIGDNDWLVVPSLEQLVGRVERPVPDVVREVSLRAVGVRTAEHGTHVLETQPITLQDGRIDVHPHRR